MQRILSASVILAAMALSSSAHTIFQEVYVNGVDQGHINGIRVPSYDGPVTDVTSNGLICNGVENPFQQPVSDVIITVPAGATVTAEWHHTLAGADPSDSADPVDPSHKGPVMTYLAQVPNALQTDVTGLSWFKIWEDGLDVNNQTWGVDRMIANKGKVTFTIPECIPAGQYLMRHEMIALHAASSYPGAQFYMECAQLQITGGGSAQPATVSFPGAYSGTDPGIKINIYETLSSYTIPGPSVFSCDGSTALPPPPPQSTVSAAPSSVSSAAPPPPSSTSTATAGHYAQCGGVGYTGPTACAAPYACVESSEYYSQCL
ncbi:glycoside hydrolase family 61 protein [Phanerochaete carnosa HHB-10118-sp]|uniref:AA9 family lytic polysaccharide monooxygenase n=1 Tax=Phanerochaete carnosa (strain HHB-10118-sp) TaxID=650164 RepID=K5UN12_PHACS|nr:glycoside hydrolase family 61 protein [Phanerochaete carnosa HHB-10118-sp]EKM51116.1 glycoside hydrolase family 61 protein [Phanerochaete carnosa HHB-10118-sp]